MPRGPKKRDITFYLLKENIRDFDQAVLNRDDLARYDLDAVQGFPNGGALFIKEQRQHPPWWLDFLRQGVPLLGNLINANTAAALILKTEYRFFAITFGYGKNILVLDSFVRDFGLRVTLNVVEANTLRSVDARTFEELTVMTRSQTSRAASLESFRISQAEDILKAVTGTPYEKEFGTRITGADAAKITYVPDFCRLGEKCNQLLAAYQSDRYKERFGFVDQLRTERDPSKIEQLNAEIVRRIKSREFGTLHLAPPEIIDLQDIESFVYEGLSNDSFPELDVEQYRDLLADEEMITHALLRKGKIGAIYRGAADAHFRWSIFDCFVAEVREGEKLYVLSGGDWYQVEGDFAEQVARDIEMRVGDGGCLPNASNGEDEELYNQRAAEERPLHLLDRKLVKPSGARTPIEFCDLLSEDKKLFHVKRRSRSSTLSHLFSQGVVSAETFLGDPTFRARLSEKLRADGLDRAAELIPYESVSPREWEIVYAVIGAERENWPRSLPFFSQLNFRMAAERLKNLGYGVSLVNVLVGC